MGSPIQKNQEYVDTIKKLEDVCKDLASQYGLNAYATRHFFHDRPNQMSLFPPGSGPILLRDNNSQLVASIETEDNYDHNQDSLVIDRVIMRIYESGCKSQDKVEALANSFFEKYVSIDDLIEDKNQGLEGRVYVVKESAIFEQQGKDNANKLPSIKVSFDPKTWSQLGAMASGSGTSRAAMARLSIRFWSYINERLSEGYKVAFLKERENPILVEFGYRSK